ncbi:hypothetical protein F511_42311 [Dorcoceras hygrometricum]|uniref:Uncharacterized protein n=1 Tax=Dorcoceras hygrometricum TaxID=472368 RepID=A0A2Z7ASN5_9LAMI|nr:hypothetical protein F511_42311 [Dorcoceras hygrometricum]
MSASGESSTTMHRLLHASGSHPIPTPDDPKCSGNSRGGGMASVKTPELRVYFSVALAFDDMGKADDAVLGPRVPRSKPGGIYRGAKSVERRIPRRKSRADEILRDLRGSCYVNKESCIVLGFPKEGNKYRGVLMITLLATRAWLRPVSRGNRHFTVGGGRLRQSGITDGAYKNQLVVVSVQYGPFNTYIPIRSTTIGKSRVAIDQIAMRTSWRSNSDIASVTSIGYPRMSASGESSTTMHRLLHASGSHPIPPSDDPKTNQYNQDLELIHSKNGNHLESPNEGSSIDHQVTIYLHAQNITMFPTNETWYFALQILVSSSGGLILILTAQSTRN